MVMYHEASKIVKPKMDYLKAEPVSKREGSIELQGMTSGRLLQLMRDDPVSSSRCLCGIVALCRCR